MKNTHRASLHQCLSSNQMQSIQKLIFSINLKYLHTYYNFYAKKSIKKCIKRTNYYFNLIWSMKISKTKKMCFIHLNVPNLLFDEKIHFKVKIFFLTFLCENEAISEHSNVSRRIFFVSEIFKSYRCRPFWKYQFKIIFYKYKHLY